MKKILVLFFAIMSLFKKFLIKNKLLIPVLIGIIFPLSRLVSESPNIIFILADDWGWTDWEMNGDPKGSTFYETPNLNNLAQQGINFTQAYATPLCSPSRAALMTGKYPGARLHLHKAITGGSVSNPTLPAACETSNKTCYPENRNHLPLNEITIAEELKRFGYNTHHFGKWHLGNSNYYPIKQGFNSQFAVGGAGPGRGGYFAPYEGLSNIPQGPNGEYLAERLTDEVCKKIEQLKNDRFFIYFSHYNVHAPYQGKSNLVKKYEAKAKPNNRHRHPVMAAMIESLDTSIGQVMAKLDQLKIADKTMLIVMGDNGGIHWANDKNNKYKNINITSNAPLQAGKCCFYEGGVRVPLIIKYPEMISPGRIENTPVHLVDFYPTLVDLANGTISENKDVVDGVSLIPLLNQSAPLEDRPIFCHFPRKKQLGAPVGGSYVRKGDYKLCRLYGLNNDASDAYELYNIAADPGEKNNIISKHPELAESMIIMLSHWLDETGALVPHPNPKWNNARIPVADAGPDQTVNDSDNNGSETINLNGKGSKDLNGNITSYTWTKDGTQVAAGAAPSITLPVGVHTIKLTVKDNQNLKAFDYVKITIEGEGSLINPIADAGPSTRVVYDHGNDGKEIVTLDGSGSYDPDGQIVKYIWKEGSNIIATGMIADVLLYAQVFYYITLEVTDNDNLTGSEEVIILVSAGSDDDDDDDDDDNNDDDVVQLFSKTKYKGKKVIFNPGKYDKAAIVSAGMKNNDAESIKVLPGYKVSLYDGNNFNGYSQIITNDKKNLGKKMKNKVSSMIIEKN